MSRVWHAQGCYSNADTSGNVVLYVGYAREIALGGKIILGVAANKKPPGKELPD